MLQCELEECEDRSDDLLDRIEEEKERRGDLTKKVAETTALAQELKKERRMVNKEYQEAQEGRKVFLRVAVGRCSVHARPRLESTWFQNFNLTKRNCHST